MGQHPEHESGIQPWRSQLIRGLLRAVVVVAAVALVVGLGRVRYAWLQPVYVVAYAGLVAITLWRGAPYRLQAAILVILAYAIGVLLLFEDALSGSGRLFLL